MTTSCKSNVLITTLLSYKFISFLYVESFVCFLQKPTKLVCDTLFNSQPVHDHNAVKSHVVSEYNLHCTVEYWLQLVEELPANRLAVIQLFSEVV